VVFAKLKPLRPRPAGAPPPRDDLAVPERRGSLGFVLTMGLGVLALVVWFLRPPPQPAAPSAASRPAAPPATEGRPAAPGLPSLPPATPFPLMLETTLAENAHPGALAQNDLAAANAIVAKITARTHLQDADVRAAEDLFARYPDEERVRTLLSNALIASAAQDRQARRFSEAAQRLRRALAVRPAPEPRSYLLNVLLEAGDWASAEAVAREIVALAPADGEAQFELGYALFRQDRNREAADALRAALAISDNASARALLDRIEKGMRDERGMTEQQLAHFHVRFDGDEHADVGREVLRVLERHYATLVRTLDHQPQSPIPVILFSREQYYTASGAPAWSGGVYDSIDGRIRIPIGGLTASLTPEMENTVIHELTHAFLADRTRGLAPRELHEGLAQYMEGKRSESLLTPRQLTVLADGRATGVGGYYLSALSFVEYLIAIRGMGGMNDLAKAMGETGNVDEAFKRVHGHDMRTAQKAWQEQLRRKYGS
jgi:tetratricopeptide (TPR) repeat protein